MKVLVPGLHYNPNLFSPIAEIFCNAKAFVMFDCEEEFLFAYDNLLYDSLDTNIGKYLRDLEVEAVICHRMCKSCFESLDAEKISIWNGNNSMTMREACQKFTLGELSLFETPKDFDMHVIDESTE